MKKRLLLIFLLFFSVVAVYANTSFKIDSSKIFDNHLKLKKLQSYFNSEYAVELQKNQIEDVDKIHEVTKMVTYYLLGPTNNIDETSESYINRKNKFYSMRYAPKIPNDSEGNPDKTSEEYKDKSYTGWKIPGTFLLFQEYDIIYKQFGSIQVSEDDGMILTMITIPNAEMKVANEINPMEFDTITTNITLKYIFKKLDGEYKLFYIEGEYDDTDLNEYFNEQMNSEYNGIMSANIVYKPDISELYDYTKLEKLSSDKIKTIYDDNLGNIIILNALYNTSTVHTATGFIINKGIAVTTWSYLDKSLRDGQTITIKDGNNKNITLEGIIAIDINNDLALLKISGSNSNGIKIGDPTKIKINDPAIVISTKTSVNLSLQKGIVMTTKPNLTNIIPLRIEEEGSPVFNQDGEVVGINTAQLINTSFSKANSILPVKEFQEKFRKIKLEDIEYKSFLELKENYYIKYNNNVVINTINNKAWKKYKNIGDVENTISLELVKASYKNGIVSLRYKNSMNSIFPNMQFANEFITNLKNNDYIEVINSEYKKIFKNDKYRVTVMSEFDYLIIVIAEL